MTVIFVRRTGGHANVHPVQSTHPDTLAQTLPAAAVAGQAINHTLVVYNDPSLRAYSSRMLYLYPDIANRLGSRTRWSRYARSVVGATRLFLINLKAEQIAETVQL